MILYDLQNYERNYKFNDEKEKQHIKYLNMYIKKLEKITCITENIVCLK